MPTAWRKNEIKTVPATSSTPTAMNPGTNWFQLPLNAAPGYAMNVMLLIIVANTESPIAQCGTERRATKYASVEVCRRANHKPMNATAAK